MPQERHRRRARFPYWLRYLVICWRIDEGLTLAQIIARLAAMGFTNIRRSTIVTWYGRRIRHRQPPPQ